MPSQYTRPYLESSCFIAWIKGEVHEKENGTKVYWKKIVGNILDLAAKGTYRVITSSWTLAEVHKRKSGSVLDSKKSRDILAYFEHPYIVIVDVTRNIGEDAHLLARKYGLKPTDSIHLACAKRAKCDVLLSTDPDLLKVKDPDIRIEVPTIIYEKDHPLFAHLDL